MRILLIALFATSSLGCFSASPGRLAKTSAEGQGRIYARDGLTFERTPDGLLSAVNGVPAAEQSARSYRTQRKLGFWSTVLGLACTGLTVEPAGESDTFKAVAVSCAAVGFAGSMTGLFSFRHERDAIERYNAYAPPTGHAVSTTGQRSSHRLEPRVEGLRLFPEIAPEGDRHRLRP